MATRPCEPSVVPLAVVRPQHRRVVRAAGEEVVGAARMACSVLPHLKLERGDGALVKGAAVARAPVRRAAAVAVGGRAPAQAAVDEDSRVAVDEVVAAADAANKTTPPWRMPSGAREGGREYYWSCLLRQQKFLICQAALRLLLLRLCRCLPLVL